jgi:hypothetical protein
MRQMNDQPEFHRVVLRSGASRLVAETLTASGARALARQIEAYWYERGYEGIVCTVEPHVMQSARTNDGAPAAIWCVRSNIGGGRLPAAIGARPGRVRDPLHPGMEKRVLRRARRQLWPLRDPPTPWNGKKSTESPNACSFSTVRPQSQRWSKRC